MLDRIVPLSILISLFVVGFVRVRRRLLRVLDRQSFLQEFADRFARYVEGGGTNEVLYVELTERVGRMERELGAYGVMAVYRPPFANYGFKNYQVIINMLPEYRRAANDWALESQAKQYANAMRDVLLRYSGSLSEREVAVRNDLRNPIIWFREGMRGVLSIPFYLLIWLGVLSPSFGSGIVDSPIMRVVSGLVAFVALLANVVQIIAGWDATVFFVLKWFPNH